MGDAGSNGDSGTRGQTPGGLRLLRHLAQLASPLVGRTQFAQRFGLSYQNDTTGLFGRDMFAALGYKKGLDPQDYRDRYHRGGIAEQLVEAYPRATWAGEAWIEEVEDEEITTPFEQDCKDLVSRLSLWKVLLRADILAGLGRYSVILVGAPGVLSDPMGRLSGPDDILFLRPLGEDDAPIAEFVTDPQDRRFGLPLYYNLSIGAEKSNVSGGVGTAQKVHYSRVVHVAEGLLEDEVYGKPRLRAVWNYLDDLTKLVGGGSEAAWKRMDPGMLFDMDPEAELSPDDEAAMSDQLDELWHGMRRYIKTEGITPKILQTSVANFGANTSAVLDLIAGTSRIPKRKLIGSERGELASGQDDGDWNDRVQERRRDIAIPITRDMVNLWLTAGAVSGLTQGDDFSVRWPDSDELSEDQKAALATNIATANQAQNNAQGQIILDANEIRARVWGLEPREDLDGKAPAPPTPPSGGDDDSDGEGVGPDRSDTAQNRRLDADAPEWKLVHRVADINVPRMEAAYQRAVDRAQRAINLTDLQKALESRNNSRAEQMVLDAWRNSLPELTDDLAAMSEDSAMRGARQTLSLANTRGRFSKNARVSPGKFDLSFDNVNHEARLFAKRDAYTRTALLASESGVMIRDTISRGIREGIPPARMARMLREGIGVGPERMRQIGEQFARGQIEAEQMQELLGRAASVRATALARTACARAGNEGQRLVWKEAQARGYLERDEKRVWITTGDSRVREAHFALEGEVVGLDEPFSGGFEPGEEWNCRCAQGIADPTDIARDAERRAMPDGLPFEEDIPYLTQSNIVGDQLLKGSLNPVRRLTLQAHNGGKQITGYWKPAEVPFFRLSGGTQADREVLAYQVDRTLGLGVVPPTEYRAYGAIKGSVQYGVSDTVSFAEAFDTGRISIRSAKQVAQRQDIGMLDVILANGDRHMGNALVDVRGNVWAIDNGLTAQGAASVDASLQSINQAVSAVEVWQGSATMTAERRALWKQRLDSPALQDVIRNSNLSATAKDQARKRIKILRAMLDDPNATDFTPSEVRYWASDRGML